MSVISCSESYMKIEKSVFSEEAKVSSCHCGWEWEVNSFNICYFFKLYSFDRIMKYCIILEPLVFLLSEL